MKKILTIIGPTASGKTSLSIEIARLINGEIIGLDSRQIYKNMEIGTAQPSKNELAIIPHHLIGFRKPSQSIAAGAYAELVIERIKEIRKRNKVPIICGGAGLYFRALNFGLFKGSSSDIKIRKKLEKAYEKEPTSLYQKLKKIDSKYAEIVHINNKKRMVRALEIFEITGKTPSENFAIQKKNQSNSLNLFTIFLSWNRKNLIDRISNRTKKMLKNKWIEEVENLIKKQNYDKKKYPALNSIGYSQIKNYLSGNLNYEELEEKIIIKTRQFSRKQTQWFRKESIDLIIEMDNMEEKKSSLIISQIFNVLTN